MNVNQIEIALSQKINASSTNFDLLAASKALQLLKTNGVFVASNYDGLPAAASNEGKIYFIEDIETVVWSNGTDWLRLLDKNTIQFQLWGWGFNSSFNAGSIGDGTATNRCSPVREFCSATDWCQVSVWHYHTTAIKTSGEIWSWGCNSGRLGDGTLTSRCSPVREICSATDWCQVSAGVGHTVAIKTSGQLWSWGSNFSGELGDGTATSRLSPVREISSSTDWCQVSAGNSGSAAVKTSGELWVCGTNSCGRLGDGTLTTRCSPVREICSATDWKQVSLLKQTNSALAVKTSGELWGWGDNCFAQLGTGNIVPSCSPVREFSSSTDWNQVGGGYRRGSAIKVI